MEYLDIIQGIYDELKPLAGREGKVADYIPALAQVDPSRYGIAVADLSGAAVGVGDWQTKFSIQSISKVFTLSMVIGKTGRSLWKCVGREPSGSAFDSLVQLEHEHGIPRNPFINAGALVVTDKLMELYNRPKESMLEYIRDLAGNEDIYFDKTVAMSEIEHSARNTALAWFMKSFGNIKGPVEQLIDIYCHQCAISMSCEELARSFLYLANHGVNPLNGNEVLTVSRSKRLSALMLTCGLYDESGDFAFRVGMPGKSGVGGGIVAVIPGKLSIAVWSPGLGSYGNSKIGMETLERFTTRLGISIF